MTKAELLKELDTVLDEIDQGKVFGSIEIDFRCGHPVCLRVTKTKRFEEIPTSRDRVTSHANFKSY